MVETNLFEKKKKFYSKTKGCPNSDLWTIFCANINNKIFRGKYVKIDFLWYTKGIRKKQRKTIEIHHYTVSFNSLSTFSEKNPSADKDQGN